MYQERVHWKWCPEIVNSTDWSILIEPKLFPAPVACPIAYTGFWETEEVVEKDCL